MVSVIMKTWALLILVSQFYVLMFKICLDSFCSIMYILITIPTLHLFHFSWRRWKVDCMVLNFTKVSFFSKSYSARLFPQISMYFQIQSWQPYPCFTRNDIVFQGTIELVHPPPPNQCLCLPASQWETWP